MELNLIKWEWNFLPISNLLPGLGTALSWWPLPQQTRRVIRRVRYLRDAHHLTSAQLLRLVPAHWGWRLATVDDDRELVHALAPKQFTWLSHAFHVNRDWLEGARS